MAAYKEKENGRVNISTFLVVLLKVHIFFCSSENHSEYDREFTNTVV